MKEVATFMEISRGTLYKLVRDGKIDHVNIAKTGNRHILGFTAQDVQRYYDTLPNSSNGIKRIDQ